MNDTASEVPQDMAHQLDPATLGHRIREQRKARRLSIRDLAARSGLSVGMISQIEQGKSAPSLRSLRLIGAALHLPLSTLFQPNEVPGSELAAADERYVVRRERRQVLKLNDAIRKELLSPASLQSLEIFNVELQPRAASSAEAYSHSGEKAAVILEGQLDLWLDGRLHVLAEGDCCQFSSEIPHRYENNGASVCKVVWILTPPSA
ncbi:cupin domain-containing protein [Bosea sp. TWI1241]|uniref:helix-turn-helix domain-containing protein n=1 Tax=Bosea sp. TWI1241 TaxID=3148904 RepID=UPI003208C958